ncbi:MAG: ImmA/IrrE family metallo-endopeptidase [bacterium]|nr:ImmA/IrrE family metallo-endopeptidase [bacterium]
MDSINAPWIRKEAIYARAEALLDEHGLGNDPVEADYILETVFGAEIVVAEDLFRTTSVHAFVAGGCRQVFVDYETTVRDPAWYNYSLAHEVGHLVLHPQVFEAATHKTRAEFDAFRRKIGQDTYSKLEQQAHLFAGALIAPAQLLERTADEVIATVRSHGIELTPMLDVDWPIIFREIGKRLNVNDRTIAYRMEDLGIYRKYI